MKSNNDVILFDLDGTLIDSHEAIYFSAVSVLSDYSLILPSKSEVFQSVGLPIATLFSRFISEPQLSRAIAEFREHLKFNGESKTRHIPGALDLLAKVKRENIRIVLVSNKQTALATIVLRQQKMLQYFDLVVGSDLGKPKPSPELINYALRKLPAANRPVMVGDRLEDMLAAKQAGIDGIFLENLHNPKSSLVSLLPFKPRIVSNLMDVFSAYLEIKGDVSVG